MKYIVDIDALKDCLGLLKTPTSINRISCVYLKDVKEMIDKFPKEEYVDDKVKYRNAIKELERNRSLT